MALIDTVPTKVRIKSLPVEARLIDAGSRLNRYRTLWHWQSLQIHSPSFLQYHKPPHNFAQLVGVASSLNRAGLFGSPASFTALKRACRYGAIFSAICTAWIIAASITLSGCRLLRRYRTHVKVTHAFFHHRKAVEKILLMTEKAACHYRLLGFAQDG